MGDKSAGEDLARRYAALAEDGVAAAVEATELVSRLLAEQVVAEAEVTAALSARDAWTTAALELAGETLAELAADDAAGVTGVGTRPWYWVGRLEGALRALAAAIEGNMS